MHPYPFPIGVLSKVYSRPTVEEVFDAIAGAELECVQFNMESAGLAPMPDQLPPKLLQRVRAAAESHKIQIVSVQGTFNMSHPDPQVRRDGLRRLRLIASSCRELGASIIAICIGTRHRENMWAYHPDNGTDEAWRDMIHCVGEAVELAEEFDVCLAVEPEVTNVVDSAAKARKLIDELGSSHLKVTMDAANLFHTGELVRMREILDDAFALVGPDIILAHAKDLSHDGEAGQEAAGQGLLDYDRYLQLLHACGFRGPILLHGLSESQVSDCVSFLRSKMLKG